MKEYLEKHNISAGALFIEIFSIVFAVLLALAVNEWRQARNDQKMVNAALIGIQGEIQQNKFFLENRLPYYLQMTTTIDSMLNAGHSRGNSAHDAIPGWKGLSPPLLQSSAYQATIATQAFATMDFETASSLSRLYAFQDLYYRLVDRLMAAALNGRLSDLGKVRSAFNELYSLGSELVGVYQQMLETMKSTEPTASPESPK